MIQTTTAPGVAAAGTPTHMLAGVALPEQEVARPEQEQAPRPARAAVPVEAGVEPPDVTRDRPVRNDRRTRIRAAHLAAVSRSGDAVLQSRANDTAEFVAAMRAEIGRHDTEASSGPSFLQRALRRISR